MKIIGAQGPDPETLVMCSACGYQEVVELHPEDIEDQDEGNGR